MPEILGRLRTPRLPAAPVSPVVGEMYYDTTTNKLFWWNGTLWVAASGSAEIYEQPAAPSSPGIGALWIDTDEVPPTFISQIPFVTSLPASPIDGQECYYQVDATNGVIWHLRYRVASSSAYKWEYIGGPPLSVTDPAAAGSGSGSGFPWFSTPALTIPRSGDYLLGYYNYVVQTINVAATQIQWSICLGDGTTQFTPQFDGGFSFVTDAGNPQYKVVMGVPNALKTGLAAGTVLKLKPYAVNYDFTSTGRAITALPVRIS